MLGVNYFSVYRLIQRGKLKACRALRGKLLVPRAELLQTPEHRMTMLTNCIGSATRCGANED